MPSSGSLANFVANLRRLSAHCNFKANALDENLHDRLICGLTQEYIQTRLFMETDNFSFDRAIKIANSLEGEKLNAQLIKSQIALHWTHKVHHVGDHSSKPQNHSVVSCYRCGGPHLANKCRFIKEKCHSCGRTGHFSNVSHSKPSVLHTPQSSSFKGQALQSSKCC